MVPGASATSPNAAAPGETVTAVGGRQVAIRGRAAAPGAAASASNANAPAVAARATRTAADIRAENHRREVERRGLTRYFADIAETAALRASAAGAMGDVTGQESARERLAALRRRIVARTAAAEGAAASEAQTCTATRNQPAAETIVPTSGEEVLEDGGRAVAAPTSNEDGKMHPMHEVLGIQMAPALNERGSMQCRTSRQATRGVLEVEDACGGGSAGSTAEWGPTSSAPRAPAAEAAASQVAWHTAASPSAAD
jgi:hypothetical protein